MAENEWLNGYLEAILDVGSERNGSRQKKPISSNNFKHNNMEEILRLEIHKEKLFSPTKYFVEEVVNSFDESDLHRTWIKVTSQIFYFNLLFIVTFLHNLTKFNLCFSLYSFGTPQMPTSNITCRDVW